MDEEVFSEQYKLYVMVDLVRIKLGWQWDGYYDEASWIHQENTT